MPKDDNFVHHKTCVVIGYVSCPFHAGIFVYSLFFSDLVVAMVRFQNATKYNLNKMSTHIVSRIIYLIIGKN